MTWVHSMICSFASVHYESAANNYLDNLGIASKFAFKFFKRLTMPFAFASEMNMAFLHLGLHLKGLSKFILCHSMHHFFKKLRKNQCSLILDSDET